MAIRGTRRPRPDGPDHARQGGASLRGRRSGDVHDVHEIHSRSRSPGRRAGRSPGRLRTQVRLAAQVPASPRPPLRWPPPRPRWPALAFDQTDPAAKVALRLPAEVANYPRPAHPALRPRGGEDADLRRQGRDRPQGLGRQVPLAPYNRQSQWFMAADAGALVGLRALWFEDTGGAHPNHGGSTLIWDTAANRRSRPRPCSAPTSTCPRSTRPSATPWPRPRPTARAPCR